MSCPKKWIFLPQKLSCIQSNVLNTNEITKVTFHCLSNEMTGPKHKSLIKKCLFKENSVRRTFLHLNIAYSIWGGGVLHHCHLFHPDEFAFPSSHVELFCVQNNKKSTWMVSTGMVTYYKSTKVQQIKSVNKFTSCTFSGFFQILNSCSSKPCKELESNI